MRTEAIDVEFMEVNMGGCNVELTNEDGTDKDLHAFRSIEMSLFQRWYEQVYNKYFSVLV